MTNYHRYWLIKSNKAFYLSLYQNKNSPMVYNVEISDFIYVRAPLKFRGNTKPGGGAFGAPHRGVIFTEHSTNKNRFLVKNAY